MKKICLLCLAILSVSVLMAQPANDDACAPIMLTIGDDCSATLPYDNTGATAQVGESVGDCYGDSSVEQTVWFAFVAPNTGAVSVNTDFANSGMQDNQLTVFNLEGGDCTVLPNFVQIACNEDRIPGAVNTEFNAALPPFPVTAGQTYYIQVDGYYADDGDDTTNDTSEGSFCIVVTEETPPMNDDCANAEVYGGFGPMCTKIFEGTTTDATAGNAVDVFSCDGSDFNATVYYTLNAGVAEVEFNLLEGENINVSLLTNPDVATCDGSAVEVTGNCFTGISASSMENIDTPGAAEVLFTNLTPQTSYLLAVWTDEGEETDFAFCLTRAPAYSCGDGECYELAESYTDCPADCPCISSVDLYSYVTGEDTTTPEAVCPEIVGDVTDPANPGLYIPFTVTTNDNDLAGSSVTSNVGSLFTSTTPPDPLPNGEATNFLTYLFLTEAELAAGGSVTITFGSDAGACDASVTFAVSDLIRPQTSQCGGCNLNIVPDYAAAACSGTSVALTLNVENGIGPNVWISQDGNTSYNPPPNGDLLVALDGTTSINFPTNDLTLVVYDEGSPNCAVRINFTSGDYTCSVEEPCLVDEGIATSCRLDPEVVGDAFCDGSNASVTIDIGRGTGAVDFSPAGIVSVADDGSYVASLDPNNCQPIDFTLTDESTCDQTPIVTINSPANIAGGINVSTNADDWGVQIADALPICGTPGAFSGTFAVLNDGDTAGGQLTDFCEPTPPELPDASVCADIAGKIAMIDRGQCNFTQKVENAQNCGAIGVVICNCQPGPGWCAADDDVLITMAAGALENEITIPAVFMLYSDCQVIKAEMNNGNEVSACIGAPETIAGCTREFTLDVCDQISTLVCETPGCTDPCDPNYNMDATVDDPSLCAGYTTDCDDGDCSNGVEVWNAETCMCDPGTAPVDPGCDDGDCSNGVETWDGCECVAGTAPVDPGCDDGDCSNGVETWDGCECVAGTAPVDPGCDDGDCSNGVETWDGCECVAGTAPVDPGCDDGDCSNGVETWDGCECVAGEAPVDPGCDDGDCSNGVETWDGCECVAGTPGEIPTCDDGDCSNGLETYNEATCSCDPGTAPVDPGCDDGDCSNGLETWDGCECVAGEAPVDPGCDDGECNNGVETWDGCECVAGEAPVDPGCDDGDCSNGVETWNGCECVDGVAGEIPMCDDGVCSNGVETYDEANCECVPGEAPVVPECDDNDCSNGVETYDESICECVSGEAPVDPGCDDGDCSNGVETWDGCECVAGEAPVDPGCDDGDCSNGVETWNGCECVDGVAGEIPMCDDGDCSNGVETYDAANCECVAGEAPVDPGCDDGDCTNGVETWDGCECVAGEAPVDPGCDDGDCSNGVETWDGCECVAGEAPVDPGCDDGDCSNGVETWNGCECVDGVAGEIPNCDDSNCNTTDSYDEANCACVNTPIDPPNPDDDCDVTDDAYDEATCTITNTPNCPANTTYDEANCACTTDIVCDDPCAPNYEAAEACETYDTTCNTDCTVGDTQVWDSASCSCVTDVVTVSGCTDANATNFNADANCDDGSCMTDPGCTVESATINGGPFTFCIGDQEDDFVSGITVDGGSGSNTAWVITDADLNILGLPSMPSEVNFDTTDPGDCLIWYVVFEDITGAEVGENAANLGGCFALSNSITVTREDCGEECTPPSAGDFNCDE